MTGGLLAPGHSDRDVVRKCAAWLRKPLRTTAERFWHSRTDVTFVRRVGITSVVALALAAAPVTPWSRAAAPAANGGLATESIALPHGVVRNGTGCSACHALGVAGSDPACREVIPIARAPRSAPSVR